VHPDLARTAADTAVSMGEAFAGAAGAAVLGAFVVVLLFAVLGWVLRDRAIERREASAERTRIATAAAEAQQRHDALMRELTLAAMTPDTGGSNGSG